MGRILPTRTTMVKMDDGAQLNVKVLGEDLTILKPVLIAHHGAPGLSTLAEPEASFGFLSDIFRVLVFDARGSGGSDLVGPFDHDRWIKDIENLRRWAGVEKFVLAGGSYGGFIALDYALLHGDRLLGLVLRDTWAWGISGMMTCLASVLSSDKLQVDVARQLRLWMGNLQDDADFEAAFNEIVAIYAPPIPTMIESKAPSKEFGEADAVLKTKFHAATQNAAFHVNMPRYDVRHRLGEIKTPTLVVVGRHDQVAPVTFSEQIVRGIPNARLEIFESSGHSPPSDEPVEFQKRVLDFIVTELGINFASENAQFYNQLHGIHKELDAMVYE